MNKIISDELKEKNINNANRDLELKLRFQFFNALRHQFEIQFPGYTLRGFCYYNFKEDLIILYPNKIKADEHSFSAYASETVIDNLITDKVNIADLDEYVKKFKFAIYNPLTGKLFKATKNNFKFVFSQLHSM